MQGKEEAAINIGDFTATMYSKGYRREFDLVAQDSGRLLFRGKLTDCLRKALMDGEEIRENGGRCILVTHPPYEDRISCTFKVGYDRTRGFTVTEMDIQHQETGAKKHYQLMHNQQLPGAMSIGGLFPRPKPWDKHIRGKFRP